MKYKEIKGNYNKRITRGGEWWGEEKLTNIESQLESHVEIHYSRRFLKYILI